MKLQPALIFGPRMVLQRGEPIPVWGRSVRDDRITVTLGEDSVTVPAENGLWRADLPPREAARDLTMTIASARTGEALRFTQVAVGEVWLAGGQSNMEFLLKYDEEAETMYADEPDPDLRFFRYPTAAYVGCVEKDAFADDGFWRIWEAKEDRAMFSGPAAYMGRKLRAALGVPVAFIGVNWGGTPAAAWTSPEEVAATAALQPIRDWQAQAVAKTDFPVYYAASDLPAKEPTREEQQRLDTFMMGQVNFAELFKNGPPPPPPPTDYSPYTPGPRAAIRPSGLYENMLKKVAPYAVRGAIWYQGEDDDFRGWYGFYDETMKALIRSWRALWRKELPFLQVELAPFRGRGITGAKEYFTMREKQQAAADALPGVHDVCILDAGDEYNIHVRKKRPVGERLALLARRYVYGEETLLAESPRFTSGSRAGDTLSLRFANAGAGLELRGELAPVLRVTADGAEVSPEARAEGDALLLASPAFREAGAVTVEFCRQNYCVDPLFNSAGLPAFAFRAEL